MFVPLLVGRGRRLGGLSYNKRGKSNVYHNTRIYEWQAETDQLSWNADVKYPQQPK